MTTRTENAGFEPLVGRVPQILVSLGASTEDVAAALLAKGLCGIRGDPCRCPVARAVAVELGLDDPGYVGFDASRGWVEATEGCLVVHRGGVEQEIPMPEAVGGFVRRFDGGDFEDLLPEKEWSEA